MDWLSFWSAVVGGVLVIAAQIVAHFLMRSASAADKKELAEKRIASLVYELLNWFQTDQHVLFENIGHTPPPVPPGHPVYALAAEIATARPDLQDCVPVLITAATEYFRVTRVLLPEPDEEKREDLVNRFVGAAKDLGIVLNKILAAVT